MTTVQSQVFFVLAVKSHQTGRFCVYNSHANIKQTTDDNISIHVPYVLFLFIDAVQEPLRACWLCRNKNHQRMTLLMGPIYKTQWKTCPGVIPTRACRHLLTNSLYGQEKQKYPHACHSVHVWEMMFQKWKTQRGRERERREGWEEVCVSVPLRVPRQGPNVGKVAQCLSHDPWGKAALPLRPRMEMWHQRKCKKGQRTHPHVPIRTS